MKLGLTRYRQGAIGAAKMAMREVLRVAHGHPAASENLGALMRITGEALLRETLVRNDLTMAGSGASALRA